MKMENHLLVIRMLALCVLFVVAGRVGATPYEFSVDRIVFIGNVPVYAEDEFDDGIIDPWLIHQPTVIESDGVVTLSNPGEVEIIQYANYLIIDEESSLITNNNLGIEDGLGDFEITSKWLSDLPTQNQLFGMGVHIEKPIYEDSFFISIELINVGTLMADIFDATAGLNIMFIQDVEGKEIEEDNLQFFPIEAEDVMESILLSVQFDDSGDLFTGEFSLDGGATFMSPFTPISTQMSDAVFENWGLYADSMDIQIVPESNTLLSLITGLVCLGFAGRKRVETKD